MHLDEQRRPGLCGAEMLTAEQEQRAGPAIGNIGGGNLPRGRVQRGVPGRATSFTGPVGIARRGGGKQQGGAKHQAADHGGTSFGRWLRLCPG